ncbi:MAG: siroheme synthase CysG [Minwuia sp.]|nr:siroheme synthase CysG [Minwuia sp.]
MQAFPIFLKLDGRPVLLAGGGDAAAAKLRLLRAAGASVRVVATDPEPCVADQVDGVQVQLFRSETINEHLENVIFAIIGTEDEDTDRSFAAVARAAGVTVNVVDRPALSDFTMPAIVDRSPVTVAISTGGAAPALARQVRGAVEAALPARLGALAGFIDSFRSAVAAGRATPKARRKFWDAFLSGPVARKVLDGEEETARQDMLTLVNQDDRSITTGRVAIVGAGPGDAELLTLKAHRLLKQADVIVHDKLVGAGVLELARRDARLVYVGKSRGNHHRTQDEINALLVAEAQAGHLVVRLKGGDPFIFGRGGEEVAFLHAHDVEVEVVPGITAAAGCAAAAGFPLTHRGKASAVTFLSGQGRDGAPDLDWQALGQSNHTLAIYMGIDTAEVSARELIAHGRSPATPVAVIENGTLPTQRVLRGRLDALPALVRSERVTTPALLVIGDVTGETIDTAVAQDRRALAH